MAGATTWFVAFLPSQALLRQAWWLRWLHPGYAHVVACAPVGGDATTMIDHRGMLLVAQQHAMPVGAVLAHLHAQSVPAWILAVERPEPDPLRQHAALRGPMSCVETVKAALGLRAPWVLTPRQLARHLRRRCGARPVLPLSRPEPSP